MPDHLGVREVHRFEEARVKIGNEDMPRWGDTGRKPGSDGATTTTHFKTVPVKLVVAYEQVWAIGTGKTATPELAAAAHAVIRHEATEIFGEEFASQLRILYGGSVKPDNVTALMAQEEIDGALVGGASLDPKSFASNREVLTLNQIFLLTTHDNADRSRNRPAIKRNRFGAEIYPLPQTDGFHP